MSATILVVDDHANTRMLIKEYLTEQGYRVATAADGAQALAAAAAEKPDLILLDVMMPNLNGFEFIRVYRKAHRIPIILLTAKIEERDKVQGLDLGADDYITKPFGMQELLARVRAVLRRGPAAAAEGEEIYRVGELTLNRTTHLVSEGQRTIDLTPSEFELLATLIEAPGRVFSREMLLEQLLGNSYDGEERTINVHISNLRKKIEPDPANPRYIETVFGIGYRCVARAA
ncbi:MAG TPA: response regulator transcription factor [Herpetosiphonaceae bacterium]|nr:response regulator transcription factor [Herpetosiphonaceae bacterium]